MANRRAKKNITPNVETPDLIEGEKVTRTGKIVKMFDESKFVNADTKLEEFVRNIEMVVTHADAPDQYWQITVYGDEALEAVIGNFLNADATAYEPKRPTLKVGDRITVTGNFRYKPWQSDKFGLVKKPTLTVYSPHAIKLIHLPGRLSQKPEPERPLATPPKRQTKPTRKAM